MKFNILCNRITLLITIKSFNRSFFCVQSYFFVFHLVKISYCIGSECFFFSICSKLEWIALFLFTYTNFTYLFVSRNGNIFKLLKFFFKNILYLSYVWTYVRMNNIIHCSYEHHLIIKQVFIMRCYTICTFLLFIITWYRYGLLQGDFVHICMY